MTKFDIKITGNGTRQEIISRLQVIVDDLSELSDKNLTDVEWEDPILMTQIWETSDEQKREKGD